MTSAIETVEGFYEKFLEKKRSVSDRIAVLPGVRHYKLAQAAVTDFKKSIFDNLKRANVYRKYSYVHRKLSTLPVFELFFVTLYHLRVLILFFWLIVFFMSLFIAPRFLSTTTVVIVAPPGTPSYYANQVMYHEFPLKEWETIDTIVMHSKRIDLNITCDYIENFVATMHERINGYPNLMYYEDYYRYANDSSLYLLAPQFVSEDNKTAIMLLHFYNIFKTNDVVDEFLTYVTNVIHDEHTRTDDFFIGLTGYDALIMAYKTGAFGDFEKIEVFAFPISFLILALVIQNFRMLILPVICMGMTTLTTFSILYFLSDLVQFTSFVPSIILSCAIGLSFDYSLFLLTRFREERKIGNSPQMSVMISLRTAGYTVLASGTTLTLCFLCLAFFDVNILLSLGLACSMGVFCCIIVNISFIPAALLTFPQFFSEFKWFGLYPAGIINFGDSGLCEYSEDDFGSSVPRLIREIFLPSERRLKSEMQLLDVSLKSDSRREHPWLKHLWPYLKTGNLLAPDTRKYEDVREKIMEMERKKRRWTLFYYIGFIFHSKIASLLILVIVILVATPISLNTLRVKTTLEMKQVMPKNCEAMDAYNILQDAFSPGRVIPFYIIVRTNLSNPEGYPVIDQQLFDALSELRRVLMNETVLYSNNFVSIDYVAGMELSADEARLLVQPDMTDPLPMTYKYVYNMLVNPTNETCIVQINYPRNPYSTEGTNWVHLTRSIIDERFNRKLPNEDAEYMLIGPAVQAVDAVDKVYFLFPFIVVFTILLVLIVLTITFFSIIVPLRSMCTISLTLTLIYGLSALFFQSYTPIQEYWSFLSDVREIYWVVPVMGFTVLIGLGLDYDIFLVMRVAEFRRAGYSTKDAIHLGVYSAGRTITAAGLIMTFAFGGLMLTSEVLLFQFGFFLCVAVLVDTFIVRTFIVPSMLSVFGALNWFPYPMPEVTRSMYDISLEMEESEEYDFIINEDGREV